MNEKERVFYDCLFCGRARKLVTSAFLTLKFMMRVGSNSNDYVVAVRTSTKTRRIR